MQLNVQITTQEIISKEDYEPTQLEGVFVNPLEGNLVIVGKEQAIVLEL